MTKTKKHILSAVICAVFFTLLFHRQSFGLNIFIIETLVVVWLSLLGQINWKQKNILIFGTGLLFTSLATFLVYSPYVIGINFISFFIFIGILIYPEAKSLGNTLLLSFCNLPIAQNDFLKAWSQTNQPSRRRRIGIFIIPLIIIIFFLLIYAGSNPYFADLLGSFGDFLNTYIVSLFSNLDFKVIITFTIGLAICNFVFFRRQMPDIVYDDARAADSLTRKKSLKMVPAKFKSTGLKDELKASIFLLVILNIILLLVNSLDVYWVWFNFTWNGSYLKQFVHEGTYLLLLSIACSIVIVLYCFRGNLNFYRESRLLRKLSYVWLAQNAVLAISVGARNYHYVQYFGLAYKRIALIFFLLLTIYGLFTVYVKVSGQKSSFYLFRKNIFALYLVLVVSSLVNWEDIIARYNFEHADKSYVDFRYLSTFPNKTLPDLDKTPDAIAAVKTFQKQKFPFGNYDMTAGEYHSLIEQRKKAFISDWESKTFLSWNLPEYRAYQKLKGD